MSYQQARQTHSSTLGQLFWCTIILPPLSNNHYNFFFSFVISLLPKLFELILSARVDKMGICTIQYLKLH